MAQRNFAKTLQQRIVVYSALGMLAVGVIAAFAGILPLATQLRRAQEKNLQVDLRRQTRAVENYVARARSSPILRLNRGKLRESLAAQAEGRLSGEAAKTAAELWLKETLVFSSNTVGICILDARGNILAQEGVPIPREHWPVVETSAREGAIKGPVRHGGEFFVVSAGPILGLMADRVGTDIVLYRLSMLQATVNDYAELGETGETIVGDLRNHELPIFFPLRPVTSRRHDEGAQMGAIRRALELAQQGKTGLLLPENSPDPSVVIAYGPVEGSGWGVLVKKTNAEFYGAITRRLMVLSGGILVFVVIGTIGMVQLLRPLAGRLILHTDELESEVYEKTAALNTELSERKRAENSLRDSEALYHSLVDTLPISILRKDLQGRVTYGNQGYCDMMKRPLASLIGKTDFDLFPGDMANKYASDDDKVVTTGTMFEDIEEHRKPDGTNLHVHVLKAPVRDARGGIVGTQVIFWDVTARKQAEEALARTAAELTRSNRELEQFAYVASHDLQEPLRMITSYTQLILKRYRERLDDDAKDFMGFAVDGAHRMQRLINDLLAYSRVGTRGKPMEQISSDEVLQAALDNLKLAIEETGATVARDPLPSVAGDSVQLIQLFQNLVGNALKFRGAERPRLYIGVEKRAADSCPLPGSPTAPRIQQPEEWVFHIRDNGIGIEAQYFERIFVIFQRLHTQDQYPGTGIGLAICKKIVERHGGRIWVESKPGMGTTFFFTLPVVTANVA